MTITRAVVRQADVLGRRVAGRRARGITPLGGRLQETASLVRRVLAQARARVLKGDAHHPDKVLRIFEPHTEVIRKGKAAKPTEFGHVVKLQEADGRIITDYQVCAPRVPDDRLRGPALERHRALFGRPPRLAVADAGFGSTANERTAARLGVRRVALPRRGRPPSTAPPRPRWYRRALRWRTGSEGRISAVKRCHGLRRCRGARVLLGYATTGKPRGIGAPAATRGRPREGGGLDHGGRPAARMFPQFGHPVA